MKLGQRRTNGRALTVLTILLAVALAAAACSGNGSQPTTAGNGDDDSAPAPQQQERTTIKLALLDDASRRAFVYALQEGIVTSDTVDVEIDLLPIGAIIEAFGTRQFDIVESAPIAVPRAIAGGLELRLFAPGLINKSGTKLYVGASSPVEDASELRGKTIGAESLGGTNVIETRYVLHRLGLDAALTGGDVAFQELPPQNLLELVREGAVDAGIIIQKAGFLAEGSPDYRLLLDITTTFQELTGQLPMNSVLATYAEVAEDKADALREVHRLLAEAAAYARENHEEVVAAAAAAQGEDEVYLDYFLQSYDLGFGEAIDDHAAAIAAIWQASYELGDLPDVPDVHEVTFR